jgi:methionyl-tRNA synthetase
VIISTYGADALHRSFGIDMSSIDFGGLDAVGVGAAWGKVAPGTRSDPHQHDEIETFVIVAGRGDLVVDSASRPVAPGTVIQFEPFETHHLVNTGEADLLFATFYWRNPDSAVRAADHPVRRRFDERPVFVFSSPTTPNGDLHLGHLSGPYLGADVFTRFQRMNGARVWHIAGSDDFQSYVAETARREGRTPAETAAHYSAEILATHKLMDIQVDQYTVSDQDPGYRDGVRDFFARVAANPQVAPGSGPALFDGETGRYLYEVDVSGGCPGCGSAAGGNMCEECGEPNFCHDLAEPRANGSAVEPRTGEITRYMLALHELRADIEAHHTLGRVPARVRELADRLFQRDRIDLALTHPGEWGLAPLDSAAPDGQVIWVWVDMAYRFLYGVEAIGRGLGEDWQADAPQADWKIVHFLGFDNSFYHAVFCPAMYKLAYPEWTPDIDYHLNEFYELDNSKFSTSRRHAVWGKDILGPHSVDAVRAYVAWTRPEASRSNFTFEAYESFVQETLIGTWQRWLDGLGDRIEKDYGGEVPDAGIWTPEHTAFLARLGTRLAETAGALAQDGFSLNRAARALHGIVADAVAFSAAEAPTARAARWKDQARTAIALELAAARLLAHCAAPVLPRFAGRLAAALGLAEPAEWPQRVVLVPPGTRLDLAGRVFFAAAEPPPAEAAEAAEAAESARPGRSAESAESGALVSWLAALVRESLLLPAGQPIADRTLVQLGMESLQSIALQYQILEKLDADVSVEVLLGTRTIAELADLLGADLPPGTFAATATAESTSTPEPAALA